MEPPEKILWFLPQLTKKIKILQTWKFLRHSTPRLSENARKKLILLKVFFFDIQKFNI